MKKSILLLITATLTTGIFLGFWIGFWVFALREPDSSYAPLVKTWDEIESGKVENLDGFAPIGNGLYRAIDICRKNNGVTSVQGNFRTELTCYVEHQTFILDNFQWIGQKILK